MKDSYDSPERVVVDLLQQGLPQPPQQATEPPPNYNALKRQWVA